MLPKNIGAVIVLFVMLQAFLSVNCYSGSEILKTKRNGKSRQKRLLSLITEPALNLYFQYNSCYALAVVLSLPLELPSSRSVFCSYNFETNYYYAYFDKAQGLTPILFSYIDQPGTNTGSPSHKVVYPNSYGQNAAQREFNAESELSNDSINKTEPIDNGTPTNSTLSDDLKTSQPEEKKSKKKQTKAEKIKNRKIRGLLQNYFMSRRRFFKMMESKMDSSGLNGRECLLKAICETASDAFGLHNGVIGSVVDILFMPSASKDEQLPKRYYKAESNGKSRNCKVYDKTCPRSLLDFISTMI